MPGALLAQLRQNGFGEADEAEDVGLEDRHELGFGRLFDRARDAVARVIDEHIDAAEVRNRIRHRALDRGGVGDVERQRQAGLGGTSGRGAAASPVCGPSRRRDVPVRAEARPDADRKPLVVPVMSQTFEIEGEAVLVFAIQAWMRRGPMTMEEGFGGNNVEIESVDRLIPERGG